MVIRARTLEVIAVATAVVLNTTIGCGQTSEDSGRSAPDASEASSGGSGGSRGYDEPCPGLMESHGEFCERRAWEFDPAGGAPALLDSECVLGLDGVIDEYYHFLVVALDCEELDQDPDDGRGWDYDDVDAPTGIRLGDSVCADIGNRVAERLDVIRLCTVGGLE